MAQKNDDFEAFVDSSLDGLRRTAYLITWDETEAEDLAQECLFKVSRHWSRIRGMEHRLAYTRRVLVRLAIRGSKHRARRRSELDGHAVEFGVESRELAGLGARQELLGALADLPARQRAVIVLRYYLDLSEADAASALGCSTGTVKSSTSKALGALRQRLASEPEWQEAYES